MDRPLFPGQTWLRSDGLTVVIQNAERGFFVDDTGLFYDNRGVTPYGAHPFSLKNLISEAPGWTPWLGVGIHPEIGAIESVRLRSGVTGSAESDLHWTHSGISGDIVAYKLKKPFEIKPPEKAESGGGKLDRKTNYYQVQIDKPIDENSDPYLVECADIIEALNMTFNEGEAFKAIWRMAAARQGRGKAGANPVYDADKAAHYGARIAAQVRAQKDKP